MASFLRGRAVVCLQARRATGLAPEKGWHSFRPKHVPTRHKVLGAMTDGAAAEVLLRLPNQTERHVVSAHERLKSEGYIIGVMALTRLLSMYTKCRCWGRAEECHQRLREITKGRLSVRSYNAILNMKAEEPDLQGAVRIWEEMTQQKIAATAQTYSTVMKLHKRLGRRDNAVKLYQKMLEDGVEPTDRVLSLLFGCCDPRIPGHMELAEEQVDSFGGTAALDPHCLTTFLGLLARSGNAHRAKHTLLEVDVRTLTPKEHAVMWTSYIGCFIHHPNLPELEDAYQLAAARLKQSADVFFYSAAIKAAHAVLLVVETDREAKRATAVGIAALRAAQKQALAEKAEPALLRNAIFWRNLFLLYEAAGNAAAAKTLYEYLERNNASVSAEAKASLQRLVDEQSRKTAGRSVPAMEVAVSSAAAARESAEADDLIDF
ncbi:Pentatricopeptide repeat-containing protein [Diplonema papillatum]|nr:Pentatricopeptide repeat-containing protein [Diplonema papillatum]